MEITVGFFLMLIVMAFICEFIDSSLGMGYGTILTPVLLIIGFNPHIAIPAILFSQAIGGLSASIFHHKFSNVTFKPGSKDLNIVIVISGFGIIATIFGALIAINIPKIILKTYIGVLVIIMGLILLKNHSFIFSWSKMIIIGIISAFNKGVSGGGFGPVVTAGQILAGQRYKGAIGVTTLAEAPICITAFLTYLISRTIKEFKLPVLNLPVKKLFLKMFSADMFQWELLLALVIGSIIVAPFGAFTTRKINEKKIHFILGILITVLGIWVLIKTYL